MLEINEIAGQLERVNDGKMITPYFKLQGHLPRLLCALNLIPTSYRGRALPIHQHRRKGQGSADDENLISQLEGRVNCPRGWESPGYGAWHVEIPQSSPAGLGVLPEILLGKIRASVEGAFAPEKCAELGWTHVQAQARSPVPLQNLHCGDRARPYLIIGSPEWHTG